MMANWQKQPQIRRVIFLAANLAPIFLFVGFVALPIRDLLAERDAEIAQKTEMLARLTAIADYKVNAAPTDRLAETKDDYLTAPSQGVAIANLQARLKQLSEASGVRLRAVQGLPPVNDGPLPYIGARLDIFGPIQAVQRAIQSIEEVKPYFFITGTIMKLSAQSGPRNSTAEPIIDAQLDVFGAFRPDTVK